MKLKTPDYRFEIRKLEQDEDGGFLITFPDLPGCMSDGETIEEAIANGIDAVKSWLTVAHERGQDIPAQSAEVHSGKFIQRIPKSLHARLVARAEQEGVSMNTLVATLIAEGIAPHKNALKIKPGKRAKRKTTHAGRT